jgi:hypothetical protein
MSRAMYRDVQVPREAWMPEAARRESSLKRKGPEKNLNDYGLSLSSLVRD